MIDINKVLYFDTETTGLPDRNWDWKLDYDKWPHICQLSWIIGDREENHIIKPDCWEIPEDVAKIHGITTERAMNEGEPWFDVAVKFIADCANAPMICGHNIYFDVAGIKANILRELGAEWYDKRNVEMALFKGKRIDTMRPCVKYVGACYPNGKPGKFPRLEELYAKLFNGETFPAHDAIEDVRATKRCLPEIVKLGLVTLEIKEYPEEQAKINFPKPEKAVNGPIFAPNKKDDKSHVQNAKGPENENFAKITAAMDDVTRALLEQNDF